MKIIFIFSFLIMSFSINADIFKCPVAGVIAYQSKPCETNNGQLIIEGRKKAASEFDAIMAGDDATSSAYVSKMKALYDAYGAYAKEFPNEAQPILDALYGDIKVINDASIGLSTIDGENSSYLERLKNIHAEMKRKNIFSLKAYYEDKETSLRMQQSIDEQNRLQAEANRIARQQQVQQEDTNRIVRQKLRDISNNQESELTKTIEHIELDEQRRVLDKTNKVAREILEIEQRRLFNEQMRQ